MHFDTLMPEQTTREQSDAVCYATIKYTYLISNNNDFGSLLKKTPRFANLTVHNLYHELEL